MRLVASHTTARDPAVAARELAHGLRAHGAPSLVVVSPSVTFDLEALRVALAAELPTARIHGATSCLGAMTDEGLHSDDGHGAAALGFVDPDGAFGVGLRAKGGDPSGAATAAVADALADAGRPGEVPAAVFVTGAPGDEEEVLRGIEAAIGRGVPILGGSAADNDVSGRWSVFDRERSAPDAVVVTALFPSSEVAFAFHSGYEPTGHVGRVTRASGRTLHEIDGRPAARVYSEWIGGALDDTLASGGNVLARTSLHPLGRVAGTLRGTTYYQLSHPDAVTPEAALTLFTDVAVGEELVLMEGTPDSLVERAGRVARSALRTYDLDADRIAGGLVVYCAGCMLTVRPRMDEVVAGLRAALPGRPFLGSFTFGEQGCFPGGENRHGNLMISVLLFAR